MSDLACICGSMDGRHYAGCPLLLNTEIAALRAEVERLRAALLFYADKENWNRRINPYGEGRAYPPKANLDNGDKARAALEERHE